MRLLTVLCALVMSALTLAGQTPQSGQKASSSRRYPSNEEWEWITKTYNEALVFGRAGKWGYDEAQGPIRVILARCIQEFGEDHYLTHLYRLEIESLKKLATVPQADRVEYMKTYTLYDAMNELRKQKRYADALQPAEQMLAIYRRLLGPEAFFVAVAANSRGQLLYLDERYAEAEKQLREALRVYGVVGQVHWTLPEAHRYLALDLEMMGQTAKAREQYEAALTVNGRLFGDDHAYTAVAANNLAGNLDRLARYEDAEKLHRRAMAIFQAGGDDHSPMMATTYSNLALNLHHQGRYGEAETMFQDALALRRRLKTEDNPDSWQLYLNFASNRQAQGNIAAAELLFHKALDNCRKENGENSSEAVWAMNSLAINLENQGKHGAAEAQYRDALTIAGRLRGDQSLLLAKLYANLASCLRGQDKPDDAVALCEKALAILRARLDPDHPDVSAALNNLAAPLADMGRHAEADKYFRDALAIMERRLGKDHPETALQLVNLAINLYHLGRYAEAESYLQAALGSMQRVLGEAHPSTAWAYKCLVGNACARGDYDQAAALAAAATVSFEAARLRLGFAGLDRARRTEDISPMPGLAVAAVRRASPAAAWQALERDLARGLLDDVTASRLSETNRKRVQALIDDLDSLDRRINVLLARGGPANADRAVAVKDRAAAQGELVRILTDPSVGHDAVAGQVYDLARIQKQLSDGEALVAWVDLPAGPEWKDPKGDHWACVVRSRGEPLWVRLPGTGDNSAWTDEDDRRARRTARAFARRPTDTTGQWQELADQLGRQRLEPLEKFLQAGDGLPAARHLIVLPCDKMAAVPVEALTKRYTVSYAPSGTMFAWLREQRAGRAVPAPILLALGAPTFQQPRANDPTAKGGGPAGASRETFTPLPGTRQEVLGIARVFSEPHFLLDDRANGQNLDELAAGGGLRRYPYLHFATHGVLDNQRPMQSALILARNPGLAENDADHGHGRLTAEQILRDWKLDAELVTLSACDTGLGRLSGGEGYLGFSQALFLAGARSLVLSLWQVDDAATALLMTRFYENLLGTPEKTVQAMPKAEALAEAKRWLRGLSPDEVKELTKDLTTRGTRGRVEPRQGAGDPKALRNYDHPFYWSGFILIGDPR